MKIAILSRNKKLYSTRRFMEMGKARGHTIKVVDTLSCYMNVASHKPEVRYKGKALTGYDAIIPRIDASINFYGTAVLRQFEMMGVYTLNSSMAVTRARDKLRSMQLLSRHDVQLPITGFAHSPDDIEDLLKLVNGPPVVIKLVEGTQGVGVILAETHHAAESVLHAFLDLKVNIMVQEFIQESSGHDIRCFVVGDKVVAAMERIAPEGEFRANIHRGATGRAVKITPTERKAALNAAKVLGLNVAGVDILRSDRGPLVLEVNASPGTEGVETYTGVDVTTKIFEFMEANAKERTDFRHYQG